MTDYQKYFTEFHDNIRLEEENDILREKRDKILNRLKDQLPELLPEQTSWKHFNQGGYAMGLGVKPVNSDYDIDVGIEFDVFPEAYTDPTYVKNWVLQAVTGHTNDTRMKDPCVTVTYAAGYHVDLAIYSKVSLGAYYLGRGKLNSKPENKIWENADPKGLLEYVSKTFASDAGDRAQFKRIIRYLKRWKERKFSTDGNAAPVGIGITIAACEWFTPVRTVSDTFSNTKKDDDLMALRGFVQALLNQFREQSHDGEYADRLVVYLPVDPGTDIFSKMTNTQMKEFREKLQSLNSALYQAIHEVDPVKGCRIIQNNLDDEFPVPSKESTGQTRNQSIFSSSSAA